MDLHGQIMNIQCPNDILGVFENSIPDTQKRAYVDAYESARHEGKLERFNHLLMLAYKIGHRDARHTAAELAVRHCANSVKE